MSHLGDLLSGYLDGEASGSERRVVDEHLAECAACRDELIALGEARDAVRSLPLLELPAAAGRVGTGRRSWRPSLAWAFSGVAAAALVLGLVFAPGESKASFDLDTLRDQHTARVVVDPGISMLRGSVGDP